jgi:phosphoglycerate dehydrogenase-like enzyme
VARGELVQQVVLIRCLQERWIAGAALDVFEEEPLPADNPLIGLDSVILTPHWLPATRQAGAPP